MSKVIPFSELSRQHRLNLLEQKFREYTERQRYLDRLRKLLFQVEAQMRQAEAEQLALYHDLLSAFDLQVNFADAGDRLSLHRLFQENPILSTLVSYLEGYISTTECYERLMQLKEKPADKASPRGVPTKK